MSRRNLTSKKRSFKQNPRSFIDRVTKQPLAVEIDDGVNPPYTLKVSTVLGTVTDTENLPDTVEVVVRRDQDPDLEDF